MSRKFDELVDEALEIERELRALSGDKPSIRGWVEACLKRGRLTYEDIEAVKERLGGISCTRGRSIVALIAETSASTSPPAH